jgi:hypothetical protein
MEELLMKKMNILNVKPGMMVARPVYSGNGVCLVAENFILNEKNIERIKHFNLDEI